MYTDDKAELIFNTFQQCASVENSELTIHNESTEVQKLRHTFKIDLR